MKSAQEYASLWSGSEKQVRYLTFLFERALTSGMTTQSVVDQIITDMHLEGASISNAIEIGKALDLLTFDIYRRKGKEIMKQIKTWGK